jgi:hypothetical protein
MTTKTAQRVGATVYKETPEPPTIPKYDSFQNVEERTGCRKVSGWKSINRHWGAYSLNREANRANTNNPPNVYQYALIFTRSTAVSRLYTQRSIDAME